MKEPKEASGWTCQLALILVTLWVGTLPAPATAQMLAEQQIRVQAVLEQVRTMVDQQRSLLTHDGLALVSDVTSNAERVLAEASSAAGMLETDTAADVRASLQQVETALTGLVGALKSGASATIQEASSEANRSIKQAQASIRAAVDGLRPLLANADRIGNTLVLNTESAVSTLTVRILAGLAALLFAGLAAWIVARERGARGKGAQLGVLGVMTLLAAATMMFAPRVAALGTQPRVVPDPNAACAQMHEEGGPLLAALDADQAVDRVLATRVRDAAATCNMLSANAIEAAAAERYLSASLTALGVRLVCRSSVDCTGDKVCDETTGQCLARGDFCERPSECAQTLECDRDRRRCIPRDSFECADPNRPCQVGEFCRERRCVPVGQILGQACRPAGQGVCGERGTWQQLGGNLTCVSSVQPAAQELCDGRDDNCNGVVDDHVRLPASCDATSAHGACRRGRPDCQGGALRCSPAAPAAREICANDVDEDCDGRLNNGCPSRQLTNHPMHCGSGGGGCHDIGGMCDPGHVRVDPISVSGPQGGGLSSRWSWKSPDDPHDCRASVCCQSSDVFKGGDWMFTIYQVPEQRQVP